MNTQLAKLAELCGAGPKLANVIGIATVLIPLTIATVHFYDKVAVVAVQIDRIFKRSEVEAANNKVLLAAITNMSKAIEKNTISLTMIAKNPNNKELVSLAEKNIEETNRTYLPHYTLAIDSAKKVTIHLTPLKK